MNLVIGGSGFIGSHLVRELVRAGEPVRVFDRAEFPPELELQPDEAVRGDIRDVEELTRAMQGCGTVYHLAGTPMLWSRDPSVFEQLNHQGTRNVLAAVRAAGSPQLVFTSTESILAPTRGNQPVTEDAAPRLEDMLGPYCRSKFLAEQAVFQAAQDGLRAIVVCPTLPIGPGDRNLTPPGRMVRDFLQGKIPGYLDCTLNFADVRDMAVWHHRAALHGEPGRRYILSGYNMKIIEFFQALARESGRPAPKLRVPWLVALLWAYLEEGISRFTDRRPQSSVTGVKLCRRSMAFDGSWTWQALDHRPRPLEDSIRDTVAWHTARLQADS
jgi:dihydroflavonol-4-reductase